MITKKEFRVRKFAQLSSNMKAEFLFDVRRWVQGEGALLKRHVEDAQSSHLRPITSLSVSLSDSDAAAWDTGVRLLTIADSVSSGWIPDKLYNVSGYRALKYMYAVLTDACMWKVSGTLYHIPESEYLPLFDAMTMEEKRSWLSQVLSWLSGDIKNLTSPAADSRREMFLSLEAAARAWSESEVRAVNHGITLVTALEKARQWPLPEIYEKEARVVIRQLWSLLDGIHKQYSHVSSSPDSPNRVIYVGTGAEDTSGVHGTAGDVCDRHAASYLSSLEEGNGDERSAHLWSQRPKHLDQYIHLLPAETQKKAGTIRQLFLTLGEARENARLLSEDPHAHADDIARWAKMATKTDDKIRAIFDEVDAEWDKLVKSGRVVADDLGIVHVLDGSIPSADVSSEGDGGSAGNDAASNPVEGGESPAGNDSDGDSEDVAEKISALRKWLIDTRKPNTARHDKSWRSKFLELRALGGDAAVTERVISAAQFYGIDLRELAGETGAGDK